MRAADIKDILIVIIGGLVTLGVELIRRRRANGKENGNGKTDQ